MKRSLIIVSAVVVILVLLIGGTYTAVQLMAGPEEQSGGSGGAQVMQSIKVGNDGVAVNIQTTILPAAELPDEEPLTSGIILDRQDDVLTVGTGAIEIAVEVQVDGATGQEQTSIVPSTNGPELEIVLTRDTLLYQDITDVAGQTPDESGDVTITQELRPATDSGAIEEQMKVQVWGTRRGDRAIADILVFGPLGLGELE